MGMGNSSSDIFIPGRERLGRQESPLDGGGKGFRDVAIGRVASSHQK